MRSYTVIVNNRPFKSFTIKSEAVDMAELASRFYSDSECKVIYKNGNRVYGTPIFMNGKEI